jgi:hypothetical protein
VELDYLAALSDAVTLDRWRAIVERAVDDAAKGDDKARAWLSRYLIGDEARLSELARLDALGLSPSDIVAAQANEELEPGGETAALQRMLGGETLIERARRLRNEAEGE